MQHNALDPIGVEVTDLNLTDVSVSALRELRHLLAEHGVVVLPNQRIDDPAFIAFLRLFGHLTFSEGETPVAGFPDLNVISNVGRSTPPRSVFHVDTSYVRQPPAYTALRAVDIPVEGGETLFTNQYQAYQTLPREIREELAGRTIRHVMTGRTALYLSTPDRCVAISGMDDEQGREMIDFLYRHSTAEDNTYRHSWSANDVVMWDNGCVMHRADHAGVVGDRVMHRGMVSDYAYG
ncbi:MAG: TauD/TfdA family dioxygenase [Nakamurella sp.]